MIAFEKLILPNGLRVLVHEDPSSPRVVVNTLYDIGSKDESPDRTGFAHLFEHLMFGGSAHIPDFDRPLQNAGGDSNAFTNNDITNFYNVLPPDNLELAFWLESDRMGFLQISKEKLETERQIVLEEFSETCLNQPYGDVWHHFYGLAFQTHPYHWPTIGLTPQHIEEATLEDVKTFYHKYYCPSNAILVVAGQVSSQHVFELADKWFGDLPSGSPNHRLLPQEVSGDSIRRETIHADVPADALYMGFYMPGREEFDFYVCDLLSDILGNGTSSRLYSRLYKQQQLFTGIDAYIMGSVDPGLLIIEGQLAEGVSIDAAEKALWAELRHLRDQTIDEDELRKLKNMMETNLVFSEISVLSKAINLAFFELLGSPQLINEEAELYRRISADDLKRVATALFREENAVVLHYLAAP
ncbi:MAG: M16 family metallopeptidase [Saprospiraceae bacterium]